MIKKNILDFLLIKYEKEERISQQILTELRETINEMEAAESLFNNTNDPRLIEAAIYKETAAKKRFDYLFSIAKEEYGEIIEI
ncbi:DUF2508 family protein [Clostridium sp. NSJ-49]|jgi:hypothetical protein|uniref:Protein of uncharacterized function (DUF2508) n=1 Tax=Clostridium disporicum TaxID=84024 RepID=A0A174HV30_9CLOT|nr:MULTISPECIES: DUF2508 family protein [Clostridium]MBC5626556.1 DUF2508 family protein [Clostridium sp. NSJ-49]MCD2502787.1 YaaL family protein [Clostridium sp. NSJ-145]CUO78753.1 Protein of uncharacterised function (DUF2508) [Clostridium disporicum]